MTIAPHCLGPGWQDVDVPRGSDGDDAVVFTSNGTRSFELFVPSRPDDDRFRHSDLRRRITRPVKGNTQVFGFGFISPNELL